MSKESQVNNFKDAKKTAIDIIKSMDETDDFIVIAVKDNHVDELTYCDDLPLATCLHRIINNDDGLQKMMEYVEIKQRENQPSIGNFFKNMMSDLNGDDHE